MHGFTGSARKTPAILGALLAAAFAALAAPPTAEARFVAPELGLAAAIVAPLEPERTTRRAAGKRARDADRDGLSDWFELRRARTNPRRRDTDRDRLSDWTEVKRTRTNPRRRDTDRDGISDWHELRRTKTDPRRADSDGDGSNDREELRAGSDPRNPASVPPVALVPPPLFPAPPPVPTPTPGGGDEPPEPPPPPPDTTPPAIQVTSGPDGLTNDPSPTFGFDAEAGASVQCSIDEGTADFGPCSNSNSHGSAEPLADGPHTFRVRATDAADNQAVATRSFKVDATEPETQVDAAPPSLTDSAAATFGFSGSDPGGSGVASFQCRVDSGAPGAWVACTSPLAVSDLDEGPHSFEVRAIDEAGNVDQSPATHTWTVDTIPPSVQIESGPDGLTKDATPTFTFEAEAGATVECSIDEGSAAFGPCSGAGSHGSAEPLADGPHTFRVKATDAAGNEAVATRGFNVDATEPETEIGAAPPSLTSSAAATFEFSGSDPGGSGVASFQCRVDSDAPGAWTPCQSSVALTGLSEGQHSFEVRAIDEAGNTDQSPAIHAWTVDTTPPAIEVTSGPDGLTNDDLPTFGFDAEADATVQCSIDQGAAAFGPCSATGSHTPAEPLDDGTHTFRVRATDAAGNQAVATRAFEVDTALPPAPVLGATEPASPANHNEPLVLGTAQAGTTVRLYVGGCSGSPLETVDVAQLEAGIEISVDDDSTTVFRATATTEAENTSGCSEPLTYVEDSAAPETQIDSGPLSPTNSTTEGFGFSGSDPGGSGVASFECRVDSGAPGAWAPCTSGIELNGLSEGQHSFEVRASDQAGNVDQSPATHAWTVDTTPPAIEVTSGPDGLTNDPSPTFGFEAEASATLACSIDQGPTDFGPCSGAGSHGSAEPLADGPHTFRVKATDAAGNEAVATRGFNVDATEPQTQIDAAPPSLTNSAAATFEFSGSDPGGSGVASFECRIDSGVPGAWVACPSLHQLNDLGEGQHSFQVRAIDEAGNVDSTPATHAWTVDTTPPAIEVTSGPDGLTNDDLPTFGFDAEAGATLACSIDQGAAAFGPCSAAGSHTPAAPLEDGAYTFRVRATDAAGNQAVATRGFQVDTALPPAPVLSGTVPPSPANHNEPLVLGTAQAGTTVRLYVGGCSGDPLETVDVAQLEAGIEVPVDDDSTTVLRATATTNAENTSGCSEPLIYVEDSTEPETQIDSGPPSPTNSTTAALDFSGSDPDGSGVASFECRVDSGASGAWETCSSPHGLTGLSEGQHTFEVRAIDQANNVDQSPATHAWQVDLTVPQPQIDSLSKALLRAGESSEVQWHGNENGSFQLRVGGGDCETGSVVDSGAYATHPAARVSNVSAAQLAEGANTLRLCLTDAAGNRGSVTATIAKDSVAPDTAIGAKPATLTHETGAEFGFSGSDPGGSGVASFQCRVDSSSPGAWAVCESPRELTGLSDGQHSFEVRAIDEAGNADQSPASHAWTVDTIPPSLEIESGPDGLTNDPSPTFSFEAEAGAAVECSIDEGSAAFSPCSGAGSHGSAEPLADGPHTFRVRGTDAAGNEAVATRDFEVDATEPETQIDTAPPSLTSSAAATFEFSGSDSGGSGIASFQCRVDSGAPGAWTPCASGIGLSGLGEGQHSFEVRAVDQAGNADSTPAAYGWNVDTVAPTTQIISAPPPLTDSASATFGFSGADGGSGVTSFECRIDSDAPGAWAPCASGIELTGLNDGAHQFEVRAIDQAGNVDPSPATHSWTVDTTPPSLEIESGPDGLTNNASPTFGFDAEAGAIVECSIDEGTAEFGPCSGAGSHGSAEPLADGPHTFRVRATDAAGNQAVATRGFQVDTALPPAPVLSGTVPPSPANHNEPLVVGEAQAGTTVRVYVGGCSGEPLETVGVEELEAGIEVIVGDDSTTVLRATATTEAENTSGCSEPLGYVEDSTAPETAIDAGPPSPVNSASATFEFSGSDPGGSGVASFQCRVDSGAPGAWVACTSPLAVSDLDEGPHSFEVRAIDQAGNTQSPASHSWTVDTIPPDLQIESGPDGLTNDPSPSFGFTAEAAASVECSIDDGAAEFSPCSGAGSHGSAEPLADGPHTFRVRATDAADNQAVATRSFNVDATEPETQIDAAPPSLTNSAAATFEFSGSDPGGSGVATFQCRVDSGAPGAWASCNSPDELTGLAEGQHTFEVRAIDQAGNVDQSPAIHTWTVDTIPPSLEIESGPDGLTNNASPTFGFDAETGASVECSIDEGSAAFGPCSAADSHTPAEPLDDGPHTFRVRATDAAGNQAVATRGFEVDTALPPAPVLSATEPASPANHNKPLVLGTAQAGTTVRLYVGGCSGGPVATVSVAQLEAGIEVSVGENSTTVFRATATTEAENTSGCSEPLVYVEDSAEPETAIDSGPPSLTNSTTADFQFSESDPDGSGVASFQCRVDSGAAGDWEACSSPHELNGLSEGQHSFEVRAIDEAGNVDQSPATHTWTVDLTAPQPQIDSLSKALLRAGESSEVQWHGNENGDFELRVGGGDCTAGSVVDSGAYGSQPAAHLSSVTAAQLAEGANTLRLCLTDAAGNRGSAAATIAKDSVAPQTQIGPKPPAKTNSTAASFGFTGSDAGSGVASFECRLDGSGWTACVSPREYAGLAEGQHSFAVRALDLAGNRDQSPAEHEWQIDLTPPTVQVESGPDNLTNNPSPSFGFSAEAGATLACSIDTGTPSFAPCSSAASHTPAAPLADGVHTFRVRATDTAGNEAFATRDFEVDATAPPSPQLDSTSPASPANENAPLLLGSALSGATVNLHTGGNCAGPPIATFGAAELETGVALPVPDNSTTVFRATATDAERTSGCSEPLAYVEDSAAPQTTIASSPPATTLSTSATFFPASSEPGSSFECSLDGSPFAPCASPASYAELALGAHTFSVRATDAAGNLDPTPAEWAWTIEPPPTATSACDGGGVEATTPTAIRAAVQAGSDVCVTAPVGNVNLSALGARPVVVSTAPGASMGDIDLASTTDLTVSRARFRTTTLRNSHRTRLLENTIGGTPAERVLDQLIFMPTDNHDVAIEGNELAWTIADSSGNTGYGCRCYGDLDRLRFVGNRLHDLAADGFQGVGGVDVTIDRNEIGPVGRNPGSSEHTDNIQITGNEANLRITNNWIHHQGYYEGEVTANAGSTYIHGGSDGSLLYENNLIETAQGRTEICGLGTGGTSRSNLTIRRNTWVDGGIAFNGFPGFEWDCDTGANNTITRNIAVDPDGGLADNGYDAALVAPNIFDTPGAVTLDAAGNCISANCNPEGEEPIGYRKPAGVAW